MCGMAIGGCDERKVGGVMWWLGWWWCMREVGEVVVEGKVERGVWRGGGGGGGEEGKRSGSGVVVV